MLDTDFGGNGALPAESIKLFIDVNINKLCHLQRMSDTCTRSSITTSGRTHLKAHMNPSAYKNSTVRCAISYQLHTNKC